MKDSIAVVKRPPAVRADAKYLEDPELALELHQSFKVMVVAALPYEGWTLSDDDIAETILHLG